MRASPARPYSSRPASTSNTTRNSSVPARSGILSPEIIGTTSLRVPNPTPINTASIRNKVFILAAPVPSVLKPIRRPLPPRSFVITPTTTSLTTTARVSQPRQPTSSGILPPPPQSRRLSRLSLSPPSAYISQPRRPHGSQRQFWHSSRATRRGFPGASIWQGFLGRHALSYFLRRGHQGTAIRSTLLGSIRRHWESIAQARSQQELEHRYRAKTRQ